MSPQRPRQQRKSACNRCRTYKLRCERDPRQADGSCERCRKCGAECIPAMATATTTITARNSCSSSNSPAYVRIEPSPMPAKNDFGNSTRPTSRLTPATSSSLYGEQEEAISPGSRELAMSMHAQREMQPTGRPTAARSEDASVYSRAGVLEVGNSMALARSPSPGFNLSYFMVPDSGQGARPSSDTPHNASRREGFTESSLGDVAVFDGSYMDLVSPSADPLVQDPGPANAAPRGHPAPKQSVPDWRGSLTTPSLSSSSPTEVAGLDSSYVDLVSPHSHNDSDGNGGADASRNYLCDVLELSRRLAEDHDYLQSADVYPPYADNTPNPVEAAVQRAVDRCSHFCGLLRDIVASGPSATSMSACVSTRTARPGRPSSGPQSGGCVLLTTSLVTAYILLVRNWRRIFVHLHRLLLTQPSLPAGETNSDGDGGGGGSGGGSFAIIPDLQLGGFRVESSPATQVAVLIELSLDMLGQIETGLGAGSWGVSGACKGGGGSGGGGGGGPQRPGQVVQGPVAISVRDMLLMQEMVRLGEASEGLDTLSLVELASQLKARLRDQA